MPAPAPPEEDEAFSDILQRLADAPQERLSFGDMVAAFGDRGFGALLLLVSLINVMPLPPGATTVTGAPLVVIGLQLALGRERLWLPRRMLEASLRRDRFRAGVARVMAPVRRAERLTRPRLEVLVGPTATRIIGLVCLALAVILVLPIPFGNMAPALAMALFGLALLQQDGAAALLGWAAVGAAGALLALAWKVVERALQHMLAQL